VPVFKGEVKMDSPYNFYDVKKLKNFKRSRKIKDEGIYVFGGKGKNSEINN
jgi:hypothetical protein